MNWKNLIRWSILAVAAIALLAFFPVPSASTPDARLEINSVFNRFSAEVAEFGAMIIPSALHVIRAENATLTATYYNKVENREECLMLTFQNDNIVALGSRLFLLIVVYFVLFVRKRSLAQTTVAVLSSPIVFSLLLAVRNFLFGSYLAVACSVDLIKLLDDPIRILLLLSMLLSPMIVLQKQEHRCKP